MAAETGAKKTVLIVEDQTDFRRIYHDVLANAGYEVLEANDGEAGWQLVRERKPDLVLLDLILPKLNGVQVLERLKGETSTKEIPVMVLTVLDNLSTLQQCLKLGANDYVVKGTYTPQDVATRVHALLQ